MSTEILNSILWTAVGLLSGSLMFSYWLGKLVGKDVRDYGDANPGAVSAWKAGGWKIGLPGALADFAKGAAPVAVAVWVFGIQGWFLVPVALAPVIGHAFSPFLKFKGGKAIAVTLGIWSGLTIWEGVLILGILIGIFYVLIDHSSWSVILAMLAFLVYTIIMGLFIRGINLPLIAVWAGNMLIFLYKHRVDLKVAFKPRPYITRLFRRAL